MAGQVAGMETSGQVTVIADDDRRVVLPWRPMPSVDGAHAHNAAPTSTAPTDDAAKPIEAAAAGTNDSYALVHGARLPATG